MDQGSLLRLSVFGAVLVIMALWEAIAPYRPKEAMRRPLRWLNNFGLMIISAALTRFVIGAAMITTALWAGQGNLGLLNMVEMPFLVGGLITIVVLDCAIYWQHRLTHIVPLFWRFHRVHHCDVEFDVSTAVRFHPIEILASALYKSFFVLVVGADPLFVVIYEMMLSGFALFNHGNVHIPAACDRILRVLFVTPDMHRVHHSSVMTETNSNYGNVLSVWDRLFASYLTHTKTSDRDMQIGLAEFRDTNSQNLLGSLWLPFRRT
ncbi:sterol desaturase family protein [Thalassospira sp. MA62]|nr:sterol desaturase family protein [Thalassospira sp. MA62]